ncbi:MAG: tyrosine-protein phosphatase [Planctomycetes bacterium]|nr:tyrosine-protein phosphatase [Planctomycetota bacterium]
MRKPMPLIASLVFALFASLASAADGPGIRPDTWAVPVELAGCPNLFKLAPDIYRGAQPSADGMAQLAKLGIKTVISLRAFNDDQDEAVGTGLTLERISFKTWHAEDEDVERFLKLIADPTKRPVFIHCLHGSDRTGTMCAIYRMALEGWSVDEALREMQHGGYGFHEIWTNLPKYLRALDIQAIAKTAGVAAAALTPAAP